MIADWPAFLPPCPVRGFEETPRFAKAAFQPDSGDPIERPRTTLPLADAAVVFRMSRAQVDAFENFVRHDLAMATRAFRIAHPRRGEPVRAKLVGDRPYVIQETGAGIFAVSMTLLVIG